jgi:hypothetical protein
MLTEYEQQQVNGIAGWKAEPPLLLVEALEITTHPIVLFAKQFVPDNAVRDAIECAYQASGVLAHRDIIIKRAGVEDIREMRGVDLERCDTLADEFAKIAGEGAMLRGALISSAGGAGAVVGMEVMVTFALKSIHTVGFCYGYCPEDPREKEFALSILLIAAAGNMEEKEKAIADVQSLAEYMLGDVVEHVVEDAVERVSMTAAEDFLAERVLESGALRSIPLLGVLLGAISDAAVGEYICCVAKRSFQERWLRAGGKVVAIAPDQRFARTRLGRAKRLVSALCYWSSFFASFTISYPPLLLFSFLPEGNSASRGFADGRDAAVQDHKRIFAAVRARFLDTPEQSNMRLGAAATK